MLNNFNGLPDQVLDLTWDEHQSDIPNISQLKVMLLNEPGSLLTLITEISKDNHNITNLRMTNRNADYFEIIIDIEVLYVNQLNKIIHNLQTKRVIQQIERQ